LEYSHAKQGRDEQCIISHGDGDVELRHCHYNRKDELYKHRRITVVLNQLDQWGTAQAKQSSGEQSITMVMHGYGIATAIAKCVVALLAR